MTDFTRVDPQFERVERFLALHARHYWPAFTSVSEHAIDRYGVLLIESVRWANILGAVDE